jgi:hypothetical protein
MKRAIFASAILAFLSGCASITGSETQQISLTTVDEQTKPVTGVSCKLQNDKGSWEAKSPSFVTIRRSAEDMVVECQKDGHPVGMLKAISRAGGDMYGNIIFGGGIGALIDHNKGNGYNYPDLLPVEMGKSVVVDRKAQDDSKRPAAQPIN